MSLKDNVAIITGGSRGIGSSYATALLNKGVKVCICDINEVTAKQFIESLPDHLKNNVFFQKCDVTDYKDFKDAFDKTLELFGRIDIIVNNAGIANEHKWRDIIEVNLIGVIHGVKLAFQYMGTDNGGKGGSIVNTASIAGLRPSHIIPTYSATKHAVVGLTKSYGCDYHFEKSGIKVNAICPGCVNTALLQNLQTDCIDSDEGKKVLQRHEMIDIEELGKAIIQILEDGKNGSLLVVDERGTNYA